MSHPGNADSRRTRIDVIVDEKAIIADGVARLTLRTTDGSDFPSWEPGAHVDLELRDGLIRQYSLCGDPSKTSSLEVAVLREVDGRGGSAHVHDDVQELDRLRIGLPRNRFPLVDADRYIFIAGGIGITPILAMVKEVDERSADWKLAYGGRTRSSMAFVDELEPYGDRVSIWPEDENGLLDLDSILAGLDANVAVYCCGPGRLLDAVTEWVPSGQLHLERFMGGGTADEEIHGHSDSGEFDVVFARSGVTLTIAGGCSILETAEAAGITADSSCREGTCGTCEVAVLEGRPDHRDSILDDEEREANDVMMICVSRSLDDRLVIDL